MQEKNQERFQSPGATTHPGISHCQGSEVDNQKQPHSVLSSRDRICGKCRIDLAKRRALSKRGNDQEEAHPID